MSRWYLIGAEVLFIVALCVVAVQMFSTHSPSANSVQVQIKLPDASSQVYLEKESDGGMVYLVRHGNGEIDRATPAEMSQQLYDAAKSGSFLGLSNPAVALWLGIGFFGQVLFTGRMVVQWVASERKGKSVVPPLFWWMSLIGSLMLLAYFFWRRDPIGLLGQAFGSFIYLKNIMWIRNESRQPALVVEEGS
jgi:lipid-A-disaccharide synthase-like uncharacterized protein